MGGNETAAMPMVMVRESTSHGLSLVTTMIPMTRFSLIKFLSLSCLLLVSRFIILAIYRLRFHPLSSFPGPKLAAITDYWELYQDFFREESGHLFLELDELHAKYGPVVRIRPNEVHVKDSHWMEVLYPGSSEHRDRDPLIGTALGTPLATIGTGPHDLHRLRRGAIAPFFSSRAVAEMEPHIKDHVKAMSLDLQNHIDEIVDLRVYFFAWTTDMITGKIFNDSVDVFWDKERADKWFRIVWDFSGIFPLTKHMPWVVTTGLALPLIVWKILSPKLVPYIAIYKDLLLKANDAVADHELSETPKPDEKGATDDIFKVILSGNLSDSDKSPKRMANEVFNLLIAGSLTTAKTASIALFHTLDNPDVAQKLRAELKVAIPNKDEMPSSTALQKLPLLSAVIKETMRVGCVVTTRFPMISKHKDLVHGDKLIPAGSSISMTYCKAGMDPEIFSEPRMFRPERWLDGSQKPFDYEHYVLPFGRGSRTCIGQKMAYTQLYILIAMLFRNFNLELYDTIRDRDIEIKGGGPLGEPTRKTRGIRLVPAFLHLIDDFSLKQKRQVPIYQKQVSNISRARRTLAA